MTIDMTDHSSNDILLVPSAALVPDELRLDVGTVPTGMIPLQGKPMLERISEAYEPIGVTKVVGVDKGANRIREYVERSSHEWTVVDVQETQSVGETVLKTLSNLSSERLSESGLYVNFADTFIDPTQEINGGNYVSYQSENRAYRWTTFDIRNGTIERISPKYNSMDDESSPTFVGQFGIQDAGSFKDALSSAVINDDASIDTFYRGLMSYLSDREYWLHEPDTWLDVGHLDTYHLANKEFLNSREFNELQIDDKNVVTKRSEDTTTLINEINWYTQVPKQLQPYLPRLYDWSTDVEEPYAKLEYIGYPSLSSLQLYGSHGQHIWDNIFHRLLDLLDDFQKFRVDAENTDILSSLEEIYLTKTRRRLDALYQSGRLVEMFDAESVQINGNTYPSLDYISQSIEDAVRTMGLIDREQFSVIHGDLCFPNVLYDPRNNILKLIDPRGKFGQFTIYGDPRYDIAKLRHSTVGHYEHLINDRFSADYDADSAAIEYEIYTTDDQEARESRFDSILDTRDAYDLDEIKLIEGLLFLSMISLHGDDTTRQYCMLAQGIEKVSPFIE